MHKTLIGVAVLLLAVCVAFIGWSKFQERTRASTECVAGADEKCPSDDFLRAWDRATSIQDELAAYYKSKEWLAIQTKQDELNGLVLRVQRMPEAAGYTFDKQKRKWIAQPKPAPPPPAPPAAAAPPPVKR